MTSERLTTNSWLPSTVSRPQALAKYTGYNLGDVELWVSKSEAAEAVYVVAGEQVERWPRTTDEIFCA
jgi:hypothetical protein